MKKNSLKLLRNLIALNKYEEVFSWCEDNLEDEELLNEIILLKGRYQFISKKERIGSVSYVDFSKNLVSIGESLISLISQVEKFKNIQSEEDFKKTLDKKEYRKERRFATVSEIEELRQYLTNKISTNKEDREKALKALDSGTKDISFNKKNEFTSLRVWRLFKKDENLTDGFSHRFWGLYNFRPNQTKWVWVCWDVQKSKLVIIKEVRPDSEIKEKISRLEWERDIYRRLKETSSTVSSGIVPLIDSGDKWFATSFAKYGNLHWHLIEERAYDEVRKKLFGNSPLRKPTNKKEWDIFRNFFVQIANTLHAFNSDGYVHRDIHPANLLFADYDEKLGEVKAWICDFDRSRKNITEYPPRYLDLDGEGDYVAPERLNRPIDKSISDEKLVEDWNAFHGLPSSDVYSFGKIILNSLIGKTTLEQEHTMLLIKNQLGLPKKLRVLLTDILNDDYKKRPNFKEIAQRLQMISWGRRIAIWKIIVSLSSIVLLAATSYFYYSTNSDSIDKDYEIIEGDNKYENYDVIYRDVRLTKNGKYRVENSIFLASGTLYIESGAKIEVNKGCFIAICRDAKIRAIGEPNNPIVFTSFNEDKHSENFWGGLVISGKAPVLNDDYLEFCLYNDESEPNEFCEYGGNDPNHSSGRMEYVIVENAGRIIKKDEEINGITFAGVGNGTTINNIKVSNVIDDCYEFFGGNLNADHLICEDALDDGFDWENGFSGTLEFLLYLSIKNDTLHDKGTSGKGRFVFEGDAPFLDSISTGPIISNVTIVSEFDNSFNYSNSEILSPAYWDVFTEPQINNVFIVGYNCVSENMTNSCKIDSINTTWFSNPYCNSEIYIKNGCSFDEGISFKPPMTEEAGKTNSKKTDYFGAFKSDKDIWDEKINKRN